MMTLAELNETLKSTGLPVAYLAFPEDDVPAMPFIVYQETGSDNFGADNRVWHSGMRIQVDLLSHKKSRVTEAKLEMVLTDADIFWERLPSFDSDEDCFRTTYDFVI